MDVYLLSYKNNYVTVLKTYYFHKTLIHLLSTNNCFLLRIQLFYKKCYFLMSVLLAPSIDEKLIHILHNLNVFVIIV